MGAVAVELVHLASLYHDDVIDEATIRRNVESVNSRFGNLVAIVAGDYLLARSAAIAAEPRHRDRRPPGGHAGPTVPGPGDRGALRLPDRPRPRRLLRRDQRQDRRAHRHVVPHRRADRRPAAVRGRGVHRVRPLLRHGLPDPRRHLGHHRDRRPAAEAGGPGPRRRASTRCPRWSRSTTPTPGPTSAPCSASRWPSPSGTRPARSSWRPTGSPPPSKVARRLRAGRANGHRRDHPARASGGAVRAGGRVAHRPPRLLERPPRRTRERPAAAGAPRRPRAQLPELPVVPHFASALARRALTLASRPCTLVMRFAMAVASLCGRCPWPSSHAPAALGTQAFTFASNVWTRASILGEPGAHLRPSWCWCRCCRCWSWSPRRRRRPHPTSGLRPRRSRR